MSTAPDSSSAYASAGVRRSKRAQASRRGSCAALRRGLATPLIVLGLAGAALAAPPEAGVLVPGTSLGGVRLGWTLARVEQAWGTSHGRCRGCATETRFFNRIAFRPEGAGVTLRGGRVVAVFTLWAPRAWHTNRGVYIGEPERRVRATYGATRRLRCDGYDALVLHGGQAARTAVYVVGGDVWGFGLVAQGQQVCR